MFEARSSSASLDLAAGFDALPLPRHIVTRFDADALDVRDERRSGGEGIESLRSLRSGLETLSSTLRRVVELHYGEDLPMSTVAAMLGISEARIGQLVGEAVRHLRAPAEVEAPRQEPRAPRIRATSAPRSMSSHRSRAAR
jgi:DNA-directed RNA polymerase specialized sigma24 family protein